MLLQFAPPDLAAYSNLVAVVAAFLVTVAVVVLLGRLLVVPLVLRVVRARNANNPTLVTATETYLQVVVVVLGVFLGLVAIDEAHFLLNTDSAIVVAGLTFALGVAGQEVFGSLISGFFLVADPDFNVGDWIAWSGGEGTVEAVDFRVTRIRTPNNETLTVPNTELTNNALTRPFGRENFRITEEVYVAYGEDTEQALLELQQVAANHDGVAEEPQPTTRIVEMGPDNVTLRAEFWVDDPARIGVADVASDFRRQVKRRFDEEAITLGPPSGRELSGSVTVARESEA